MKRFAPIIVLLFAAVACAADKPKLSPAAAKVVGAWKLVKIEERGPDGKLTPPLDYGPDPVGLLIYDALGNMSVHAMRRDRPRLPSDDVHRAPPDLAKAAFTGYGAYFGTFSVDEKQGLITHHVVGSLIPNWEGSEQRRRYTIDGDKLTLEPPEFKADGQSRSRRLTWQRVGGK